MQYTGLNMEAIKTSNRVSILRHINRQGPTSKKDIAEALKLTPAAVTLICAEHMESGLLIEKGVHREEVVRAGRRKVLIDINENYRYIFGINIDPDKSTVVLCNLKGKKLAAREVATKKETEAEIFLQRLADVCEELRKECKIPIEKVAGTGVAITGVVDKEAGESVRESGVWSKCVNVREILETYTNLPAVVENGDDAFAKAEVLYGAGCGSDSLLLVKWGDEVTSTMIIDDEIYTGAHGRSSEIGHYIVDKNGVPCECGRCGCLETVVARGALGEQIPEILDKNERLVEKYLPEQEKKALDEAADTFAHALANSMTILAPQELVLYGDLFKVPALREAVFKAFDGYESKLEPDKISVSSLIDKEDYIGSVAAFVEEKIYC